MYNKIQDVVSQLPVVECGGLMYLAKDLVLKGSVYPMVDVLPLTLDLSPRPQGHGYTIVQVDKENPYFEIGATLKGHEFHYSSISEGPLDGACVYRMTDRAGMEKTAEGFVVKRTLGSYVHLHFGSCPQIAVNFVNTCRRWADREKRKRNPT